MKIPQIPQQTALRSNGQCYVVSPDGSSICTSGGQVFTLAPSYGLPQQPSTAVVIEQPQDNWAWLKNVVLTSMALIAGGQILSHTGSNYAGKVFKPSESKDWTGEKHLLVTGNDQRFGRARNLASSLAEHLELPSRSGVAWMPIGGDIKGPVGYTLSFLRSALHHLNMQLKGFSPFGSGNGVAIERGAQSLSEHLKTMKGEEKLHLHGYSAGGMTALDLISSLKNSSPEELKKIGSLTLYGAPIPLEMRKAFEEQYPGIKLNHKMNASDPFRHLAKAGGIFSLPVRGLQALRDVVQNGLQSHEFVGGYVHKPA